MPTVTIQPTTAASTDYGVAESYHASSYFSAMAGNSAVETTAFSDQGWAGLKVVSGAFTAYETFIRFDLSPIPDGAVINDASLEIWPTNVLTDGGSFILQAYNFEFDLLRINVPTYSNDWRDISGLTALADANRLICSENSGTLGTGAYVELLDSKTNFVARVQQQLDARASFSVVFATNKMRQGLIPTDDRRAKFYAATAAANRAPKLTIDYTAPPGVSLLMGVSL